MTNFKQIITGNALYLVGFLTSLLSVYIVPPFLDAISTAFSGWTNIPDATLQGIAWICLILIWLLAMLVTPTALIVIGLQEEKPEEIGKIGTVFEVARAILWALFTILLFYLGRFWLTAFASAIPSDYPIVLALFWITVIVAIIMNVFAIPAYIINKHRG